MLSKRFLILFVAVLIVGLSALRVYAAPACTDNGRNCSAGQVEAMTNSFCQPIIDIATGEEYNAISKCCQQDDSNICTNDYCSDVLTAVTLSCQCTHTNNSATASCTKAYGTCNVNGIRTCSGGVLSTTCVATDPRIAACSGKTCGSNTCGGTCGTCAGGYACNSSGQCILQAVPVNGACSATTNSCTAGSFSDTADGTCTNNWNCTGSNGGTTASCTSAKPPVQGTLSAWSTCTAACGGGTCIQTRTCTGNSCGGNCNGASLTRTYTNNAACGTCNDGNSCTTDGGIYPNCTHTNNTNSCNDGNSCTTSDRCSGGSCSGTNTPVQGTLSVWSTCTGTCGGGSGIQTRTCTGSSCGGNCNGASLTQGCVNNTACSGIDLTSSSPSPSSAIAGTPVSFTATITNGGSISTGVNFRNFFQVSTAANGGGTVSDLVSTVMSALASGASNTATSPSYTFPSAGTYSVRTCADKSSSGNSGVITELNEGNNCSTTWTNVTVASAAAAVVSITANSTTIPYNTATMLNWSYSGATSCTITPPATIGGYPNGSGSVSTGNLTVGRTYTISCSPGGANSNVTVNVQVQPKDLTVIKTGQGTITSSPSGISCGTGCSNQSVSFSPGTSVVLTATVAAGRIFTGWSGVTCGGGSQRDSNCSFTINSDITVIANFAVDPNYQEF